MSMRRLLRRLLPRTVRLRLWVVGESMRLTHLRRRYVRLPVAKAALALGVVKLRLRTNRGGAAGVDRLQHVLVINLQHRPERLAGFMAEMTRLGIEDATRFEAIADEDGMLGCTLSHAAVMQLMVERGWACVMVCEDDARFSIDRKQLDVLVEAFLADPHAEVACLAYWHWEVERHSLLYLRTTKSLTTACYLVKASIAADLGAVWEEGARQLAEGGARRIYGVDHVWNGLQRTRIFLVPIVRAAHQAAGHSDRTDDYMEW